MSKRARILIVDDERSIRELLEIVLKKDGFNVTSVRSAVEALTLLKSSDFDLIISDIKMPDMTGIDLLRQLRETTFGGQFILLTAFASSETAIQALKMGAFDYILKTENFIEELKLVVYSALENRRFRGKKWVFQREFPKLTGMCKLMCKRMHKRTLINNISVVTAHT